ncbi:MAG TPA: transcriptional regulator NrdR [Bacillota bacterium]|jgi:transcriptional repressor NrdR
MRCPYCGEPESKVLDSRPTEEGAAIRRRRECLACGRRFTTYEKVEELPLVVIKKDGRRESFDRVKLLNGLLRAGEKRPIPLAKLEALVADIERQIRNRSANEVDSRDIGELAMEGLRQLDEVAYVRFASVYRSFKDINDINRFLEQLETLVQKRS